MIGIVQQNHLILVNEMKRKHMLGILILFFITATFPLTQGIITKEMNHPNPDKYREVFTYIYGTCHSITINKRGIIRNVEFDPGAYWTSIEMHGLRRKINGSGLERFWESNIDYIHAPCYLGIIYKENCVPITYHVYGFAFGNIDWRENW